MQLSPIIDFKHPWRSLRATLRRNRALRHLNRDLAGLTNKELADLLAKAGLRRGELFTGFKGNLRHRRLMGQMLTRFDIDHETACEHHWRQLVHAEKACARCLNAEKCRRWLAWGRNNGAPYVFCRNAGLFAQMRQHLDLLLRARPRTYAYDGGSASAEAATVATAWSRVSQLAARPSWLEEPDPPG